MLGDQPRAGRRRRPSPASAPGGCRRPATGSRRGPGRRRSSSTSTGCSSPASAASAAPITGAPCSGVKRPKNTARSGRSASPVAGRAAVTGVPGLRCADRDHQRAATVGSREGVAVLVGVDDDDVGAAERRGVQPAQQALPQPARHAAVGGRVAGADQVVEDDRHVREQPPGQQHVEVTEVADDHRVRPAAVPAPALRADGERAPAGQQPPGQQRQGPRPAQHRHPGGGRQAERARCTPARWRRGPAGRHAGRRPGGAPQRRRCRRTGGASRATLTSSGRGSAYRGPVPRPTSPTCPTPCGFWSPPCWWRLASPGCPRLRRQPRPARPRAVPPSRRPRRRATSSSAAAAGATAWA